MKIHLQTHNTDNFIKGWYLDDLSLCDTIVEYFENNNQKFAGQSSHGVDVSIKDSTDCHLLDSELLNAYVNHLIKISQEYIKIYPYANYYGHWGINENINVQRYESGQAYYAWHTERGHAEYPQTTRHLVFMTYLNNVQDDGETEFLHQKLKVKPEKGLTLIWPADWTYTHRGVETSTTKYITTGWFNYFSN